MAEVSGTFTVPRRTFSDVDFSFAMIPGSHDVAKKNNLEAIKQSIKNLILTRNFERPFNAELGSQINSLLFELWTPLTKAALKRAISDVINNYEPRVRLDDVIIRDRPDNNALDVTLTFHVVNTNSQVTLSVILKRTR